MVRKTQANNNKLIITQNVIDTVDITLTLVTRLRAVLAYLCPVFTLLTLPLKPEHSTVELDIGINAFFEPVLNRPRKFKLSLNHYKISDIVSNDFDL